MSQGVMETPCNLLTALGPSEASSDSKAGAFAVGSWVGGLSRAKRLKCSSPLPKWWLEGSQGAVCICFRKVSHRCARRQKRRLICGRALLPWGDLHLAVLLGPVHLAKPWKHVLGILKEQPADRSHIVFCCEPEYPSSH